MSNTGPRLLPLVTVFAFIPIGPLAVDMYLPSIPQMVDEFGVTEAQMQLSISVYVIALGLAQLLAGPASDRWGRKLSAITGLLLYSLGSLSAAQSDSLLMLYLARVLQGAGAAFAFVTAMAWVRDHYEGAEAGRWLSYMGGMTSAIPMIAPLLGGLLAATWGWSSVFYAMALLSMVVMLMATISLKREAAIVQVVDLEEPEQLSCNLKDILTNSQFRVYSLANTFSFGALLAYIATAPIVAISEGGLSQIEFSLLFGVIGFCQLLASFCAPWIVARLGQRETVLMGLSLAFLGGLGLWFVSPGQPYEFFLMAALGCGGFSILAGTATSLNLQPFKYCAGLATSIEGFMRMVGGAVIAALVGSFGMAGASTLSLALVLTLIPASMVFMDIRRQSERGLALASRQGSVMGDEND